MTSPSTVLFWGTQATSPLTSRTCKRKFDVSPAGTPVPDKTSLNTFGLTLYFGTKLSNPSTRREKRSTSRGHFWRLGRQYARWLRSYLYFVVLRQQIIPVLMTYVSKIIIRRVRAALCLNRALLSQKLCLDSIRFGLVFSFKIADPVWVAQVSTRHLSVISSQ